MNGFLRLFLVLIVCASTCVVSAQDAYSMYWNAQYNAAVAHAYKGMQQLNEMGQAFVKGFGESLREQSKRQQEEFERNPNNQLSMAITDFANEKDDSAIKRLTKIILNDEGELNQENVDNYPQTFKVALKYVGYCFELGIYFEKDNENAHSYYVSGGAEDELARIRTSGYVKDVSSGIKNFRLMCQQINLASWQATQGIMSMPTNVGIGGSSLSSGKAVQTSSTCMQCYGTGKCPHCTGGVTTYSYTQTQGVCSICNGTGRCTSCRGTGKRP